MLDKDYAELKRIAGRLAAVAAQDANPDNWIASGLTAAQMSKDERGDAYWCRKVATASLTVLTKVLSVAAMIEQANGRGAADGAVDLDPTEEQRVKRQVDRARREAARYVKAARERTSAKGH